MNIDDYNAAIEDAAHVLTRDLPIHNEIEPWLGLHDGNLVRSYAKDILALRKPKLKHNKDCELGDNWKECPACLALREVEETK